jgi:DNA-binding response OmpR family regulator
MNEQFKILVVDDESINLQLVTSALKGEYTLFVAENGHEAIDLIGKHNPDLILLDVMMPELNGFEVCTIIKSDERYADIPVIFLTALDSHEAVLQGLELGAIDYLIKPFNIGMLKLRVRNHLALKAQRDLLKLQNKELEEALARVKQLEGIIPICMYCKRIRDDQSSWQQLEEYISEHSEAHFSHGICPHCVEEQMKKM